MSEVCLALSAAFLAVCVTKGKSPTFVYKHALAVTWKLIFSQSDFQTAAEQYRQVQARQETISHTRTRSVDKINKPEFQANLSEMKALKSRIVKVSFTLS